MFPELFWPVISDYHKVDASSIKSLHDFGDPKELADLDKIYSDSIVSTRIRVGRTLHGFPMGPKLTRESREEIETLLIEAFRNLQGDLYGDYLSLNELSNQERDHLIETHYLYANADDKYLASVGGYNDWYENKNFLF